MDSCLEQTVQHACHLYVALACVVRCLIIWWLLYETTMVATVRLALMILYLQTYTLCVLGYLSASRMMKIQITSCLVEVLLSLYMAPRSAVLSENPLYSLITMICAAAHFESYKYGAHRAYLKKVRLA